MKRFVAHLFVVFASAALVCPAMANAEPSALASAASARRINDAERIVQTICTLLHEGVTVMDDCDRQNAETQADKLLPLILKIQKLQQALKQMVQAEPELGDALRENTELLQKLFVASHDFVASAQNLEENDYYGSERLRDALMEFVDDDSEDEIDEESSDDSEPADEDDAGEREHLLRFVSALEQVSELLENCDSSNADEAAALLLDFEETSDDGVALEMILNGLSKLRKQDSGVAAALEADAELNRRLDAAIARYYAAVNSVSAAGCYQSSRLQVAILRLFL